VRGSNHRVGARASRGVSRLTAAGGGPVDDPSGLFLADRRPDVPGSVVAPLLEGTRPLLVEIQALVVENRAPSPRRSATGLDRGRLPQLLAVLERRVGLPIGGCDVFCSVVGGIRAAEPGIELAVALAVVSAFVEEAVPFDLLAVGEVGLGGEVRQVSQLDRRLGEASRLGYRRALVPGSALGAIGLEPVPVATITDAVLAAGLLGSARAA
jgi:DNA repair protein RadA/Sms